MAIVLILLMGCGVIASYRAYVRNRTNRMHRVPPDTARPAPLDVDSHNDSVRAWIAKNAKTKIKWSRRHDLPPVELHRVVVAPLAAPRSKMVATSKLARSVRISPNDVGTSLQNGPVGTRLTFEYANADGEITKRSLTNWIEYTNHVRGYCSKRKAVRTFRKDRVLIWIDVKIMLYNS